MSATLYDYCIIGAGASGLHLALAMSKDSYFDNKRILILDKSAKNENDKTWCFWEKGVGEWDEIIDFKWDTALFYSDKTRLKMGLAPYSYKKIKAIAFYENARRVLSERANFNWLKEEVSEVKQGDNVVEVVGASDSYRTSICFDSRIDVGYHKKDDKYIRILQHFKGWVVTFDEDVFDPEVFTLMDFRLKHENSTSFSYVLPSSKREALVEFTLFTKDLLPEEAYDNYLRAYITQYVSKANYEIMETEYGVIPMTNYPFHKSGSDKVIKIGTAGSWVRASTGYSFKNAERNVQKIISNLKNNRPVSQDIFRKKYSFYDSILLEILLKENHLGEGVFSQLYDRNKVSNIFKFLDGESTLIQELRIIGRLNPMPFLRALWRHLFR